MKDVKITNTAARALPKNLYFIFMSYLSLRYFILKLTSKRIAINKTVKQRHSAREHNHIVHIGVSLAYFLYYFSTLKISLTFPSWYFTSFCCKPAKKRVLNHPNGLSHHHIAYFISQWLCTNLFRFSNAH